MGPSSEWSPGAGVASPEPLDGRYRLEAPLGRGGMGVVYRALDMRLNRPVAVKLLRDVEGADRARFQAEVRTLARLAHPNLVRLLDAGEADGRQYLVMELIDGPTLAQRIPTKPLRTTQVAAIGAGVAAALGYVHGAGIVHRDVKPANVLLDIWGNARLADFGIARLVDTSGLTATGLTLGTPAYLSPEQVLGLAVGPAADVYALALVLIESISGHRAFEGTAAEIAAARLQRAPAIPAELDDEWHSILGSMTALDAADRCSAAEAASRLGDRAMVNVHAQPPTAGAGSISETTRFMPIDSFSQTPRLPLPGTVVVPARPDTTTPSPVRRWATRLSRRGAHAILLGVSLLALGLGITLGIFHLGSGPSRVPRTNDPRRPAISTARSSSTTTSTSTSTSTTSPPPASVASVSPQLITALENAVGSGNVAPQAGQQLAYSLQQLNLLTAQESSAQQVQQFDQLAELFDQDVADGLIVGASTVATLTSSMQELATALDTTLPSPTTVTVPSFPGGYGNGHGAGRGH